MSTMTQIGDATERITVRRRRSRRRRWLLGGIVVLVMALLGAGAWVLFGSNVLGVRSR